MNATSGRPVQKFSLRGAQARLVAQWRTRFAALPPEAQAALRSALLDLSAAMRARGNHQWAHGKPTMGWYSRIVAVYARHLAHAIPYREPRRTARANHNDGTEPRKTSAAGGHTQRREYRRGQSSLPSQRNA